MSRISKRDGSTVRNRLKNNHKARQAERQREWMDRKVGRTSQPQTDSVQTSGRGHEVLDMWAQAASMMGMKAESDGKGGYVFSEPARESDVEAVLRQDEDGILRWEFEEAQAPQPGGANVVEDVQLVTLACGTLKWLFPGDEMPHPSELSTDPSHSAFMKEAAEMAGMKMESNGQGGYILRD